MGFCFLCPRGGHAFEICGFIFMRGEGGGIIILVPCTQISSNRPFGGFFSWKGGEFIFGGREDHYLREGVGDEHASRIALGGLIFRVGLIKILRYSHVSASNYSQ